MIVIIDYKAGNLTSVARAVSHLGFRCEISQHIGKIALADRIIIPGVGAAGSAMSNLRMLGLDKAIRQAYAEGIPILGICLGSQIIMEVSEENQAGCLGLIPGFVQRFPNPLNTSEGDRLKVPHMGWNRIIRCRSHPILEGIDPKSEFYFVHAYFPKPEFQDSVIAITDYGISFPSAVGLKNLIAFQFHPEKSGRPGLKLLENFCTWDGGYAE
nr:imidazole glycerol phosphate synthase subunit HisH [Desulfobacterales bacterium]